MKWLHDIIDTSLQNMFKIEILRMTPHEVPKEMQDNSLEKMDDWSGWKPMNSTITDSDISVVEEKNGFLLPPSFKEYLKYKFFFELHIPDHCVRLPMNLPDTRLAYLYGEYESEYLIDKGYLYFADFQDYGLLCFDINSKVENNEYQIAYVEHENLSEIHLYANNFRELMEADNERGNRFIGYMNDYYKSKK